MPLSRSQRRSDTQLDSTPYDDLLCFNFYQGWRAIQDFYASGFPDNLNAQRSYIIGLCIETPCSISEIASALRIDDAAISNIVKRMEKDGLLARRKSSEDSRKLEIHVTEKGQHLAEQAYSTFRNFDKILAACITPEERKTLTHIVNKLHSLKE